MPLRSGFVSIIGRPNAGKSTLLNALLGEKIAIVTHKPQTTRTRILGVLEVPAKKKIHPPAQVVLVDTPGVHKPSSHLDKRMMQEVHDALESRDVVLFIVDATHRLPNPQKTEARGADKPFTRDRKALSAAEDEFALSLLKKVTCPVLLILNKIDMLPRAELLPLIAHWSTKHDFAEVIPISAKKRNNLDLLLQKVSGTSQKISSPISLSASSSPNSSARRSSSSPAKRFPTPPPLSWKAGKIHHRNANRGNRLL